VAPPRRTYEQRIRAESAEATRARILDAFHDLLRERPDGSISVDQVAKRARVARSTVYLAFGSRRGLFDALTERLLSGEGFQQILAATADPDARVSLRGGIAGGVTMYAAEHEVLRVLDAMRTLDPAGAGEAIARDEAQRSQGMARLARRLGEQDLLRPGLTPERAAHVIWLFAGFEAFDTLATGRGLTPAEVTAILTAAAEHALLADPSPPEGAGPG
jgi:AcrR family transcriptional regulator